MPEGTTLKGSGGVLRKGNTRRNGKVVKRTNNAFQPQKDPQGKFAGPGGAQSGAAQSGQQDAGLGREEDTSGQKGGNEPSDEEKAAAMRKQMGLNKYAAGFIPAITLNSYLTRVLGMDSADAADALSMLVVNKRRDPEDDDDDDEDDEDDNGDCTMNAWSEEARQAAAEARKAGFRGVTVPGHTGSALFTHPSVSHDIEVKSNGDWNRTNERGDVVGKGNGGKSLRSHMKNDVRDWYSTNSQPRHLGTGQWRPNFHGNAKDRAGADEAAAKGYGTAGFRDSAGAGSVDETSHENDDSESERSTDWAHEPGDLQKLDWEQQDSHSGGTSDDHQNPKGVSRTIPTKQMKTADGARVSNFFPPPHAASQQALGATAASGNDKAMKYAQSAHDASADGNSTKAAIAHLRAAGAHDSSNGDDGPDQPNQDASALHRQAAMAHQQPAPPMPAGNSLTENDFEDLPEDAQRAAFAHMGASSASEAAHEASKKASKFHTASTHMKAAQLHATAGQLHKAAGNDEQAEKHFASQQDHQKKAWSMKKMKKNFDRKKALEALAVNMSEEDLVVLNALSDQSLAKLATNAKPDSSNADVSGSGDFDDADEEGGYDDAVDSDTEYQKKGEAGTKGKKSPKTTPGGTFEGNRAVENWLNESNAPDAVKAIVRNSVMADHQQKLAIARRMVANIRNREERNRVGNKLMAMSLDDLRLIGGRPQQTRQVVNTPVFFGAAGGPIDAEPVTNSEAEKEEVAAMVPPTMNEMFKKNGKQTVDA